MAGEYIITVGDKAQLPTLIKGDYLQGRPEPRIAMVGRSNVGKSSLINALMGGSLARVSKQPGKTRHIHFYAWKEAKRIIADLPGYGFARASMEDRDKWSVFVNAYLRCDKNLDAAVVLLDARHGPTKADQEAIRFLSFENIPVIFVMTKFDTLKTQSERVARKREVASILGDWGVESNSVYWVSAKTKDGLKALSATLAAQEGTNVIS